MLKIHRKVFITKWVDTLLQNAAAFLLQIESIFYYKTRQLFYYKMSWAVYYKTRHNTILFTKIIKRSKFVCSFKEGFNTLMNNTSRLFLRSTFIGALPKILHSNSCSTSGLPAIFYHLNPGFLGQFLPIFQVFRHHFQVILIQFKNLRTI